MFDSGVEKTIVIAAVVLWFAHGWYLNNRLLRVHEKLGQVLEQFNGLRNYLYEIDPQFDDERETGKLLDDSKDDLAGGFAAMDDCFLIRQKEQQGKRTLNTRFDS